MVSLGEKERTKHYSSNWERGASRELGFTGEST